MRRTIGIFAVAEATARNVFDVAVDVIEDPVTGGPPCAPAATCRTSALEPR